MFNHVELDLPRLERETIDGVRYYKVPLEEELLKLVSITSVTSHKNRNILKYQNLKNLLLKSLTHLWIDQGCRKVI